MNGGMDEQRDGFIAMAGWREDMGGRCTHTAGMRKWEEMRTFGGGGVEDLWREGRDGERD
eukprot:352953-Chlamydomonas_euryale.AAC.9